MGGYVQNDVSNRNQSEKQLKSMFDPLPLECQRIQEKILWESSNHPESF